MSRRSRSRSQRRLTKAAAKRESLWPAVAFVLGLIVAAFAIGFLEPTGRTLLFWLFRDDYIRTELKVTHMDSHPGEGGREYVYGVIAATGEKFTTTRTPKELFEYDSPSDPIGNLMPPEAAPGMIIPIWFAEDHDSFFQSARVHFVSEFETLPSAKRAFGVAAVNVAVLAVAVCGVVVGIRRLRESETGLD